MAASGHRRARGVPPGAWAYAAALLIPYALALLAGQAARGQWGMYYGFAALLVAPAVACALSFRRALTAKNASRRFWLMLAVAIGCWTIGEAIWTSLQLPNLSQNPFPSPADAAYLLFSVITCIALLCYPAANEGTPHRQTLLDALIASCAFALISWQTALGAVYRNGGTDSVAFAVSLAYPVTDLLVLALVLLTLARTGIGRLSLSLVAFGCALLAISDSLFVYLTATTGYTGGAVSLLYMIAFVVMTMAAVCGDDPFAANEVSVSRRRREAHGNPSLWPYLPIAAASAVTLTLAAEGHPPTAPQLALASVGVALLLTRQYLVLRRNSHLTTTLASREAQLLHQAFHDRLTGLANRALFQDRLTHALQLHRRDLRPLAVIFLDLDDFKLINDTLGHGAGDELLCRVAQRLIGAVRNGDTVARLGGDEFAVLVEDGGDPVTIAAKIVDALRTPFFLTQQAHSIGASIGIFELDADDNTATADLLLMKADTAMYAAKRSGKDRIALYRDGMSLTEVADDRLARALAEALTTGDLVLEYQPIIDLGTGRLHGVEALARWYRDGELISPAVFVPLAERTGRIADLTWHVLRLACSQLAAWSAALGHQDVSVAVNVPPCQITQPGFVPMISALVDKHRLAPGQLVLEITESGAFEDLMAARAAITALRVRGVAMSLDDFGVGQSSLAQLHNVDLDSVKIDKSFIETLDTNPRQAQFLRALLRLSEDVNLQVIVEGVERPEQLSQLLELGRPLAQGYLFSRPLAPDACLRLLVETTSGGELRAFPYPPAEARPASFGAHSSRSSGGSSAAT